MALLLEISCSVRTDCPASMAHSPAQKNTPRGLDIEMPYQERTSLFYVPYSACFLRRPEKSAPTATEEALAAADGMSGEEISRAVADEQERQKEDAEVRDGDPHAASRASR